MNERDDSSFEGQLKRLQPAEPPRGLMNRLRFPPPAPSKTEDPTADPAPPPLRLIMRAWLRWIVVAGGAAALVALMLWPTPGPPSEGNPAGSNVAEVWVPDEIEVDRELVAVFEGVTRLPNGLPVRFHLYDWDEALIARDAEGRLEVERRGPQLEIVPVSFEIY